MLKSIKRQGAKLEASSNISNLNVKCIFNAVTRFAATVLLVLTTANFANAARYAIVFKEASVYNQVNSQFQLSNVEMLSALRIVKNGKISTLANAGSKVKLNKAVVGLNTLIVNAESEAELAGLKNNSDVLFIEKEVIYQAPRPVDGYRLTKAWDYKLNRADMDILSSAGPRPWGIDAVRAPQAWALGADGTGARVAILDSGIDHDHPSVRGNIEVEQDFVKDNNSPYPVADAVGHGTHVAGTIAGAASSTGWVGVAPKAKLLIGRVCAPDGCSNMDVVAGIDWAVQQHADVVNMSLGSQMSSRIERMAVERAENAGVMIVAASGNDGDTIKGKVGFPAAHPSVFAVGAVDESLTKADFSQWGPELDVVGPGVDVVSSVPLEMGRASEVQITMAGKSKIVPSFSFSASADAFGGVESDLIYVGTGKTSELPANLAGKIALIKRGEISFGDKVKNALAAGAAGAIIFNNQAGPLRGTLSPDGTTLIPLPAMSIEQAAGDALVQLLNQGKQITVRMATVKTDYDSYSGTSMATPHVTGVAALVRGANKNLTPAQVRALLQKTAKALGPNTQNEYGAGIVNAEEAARAAFQLN